MELNKRLVRRNDIITADMDGNAVTMDMKTGKYYNLGQTGGYIWNQLEKEKTVEELMQNIMKDYNISEEVCKEDVFPFLEDLIQKGLLTICE